MPTKTTTTGQRLVYQAKSIYIGAKNLICEGGTPDMVEECRREMGRVAAAHRALVTQLENRLRSLKPTSI